MARHRLARLVVLAPALALGAVSSRTSSVDAQCPPPAIDPGDPIPTLFCLSTSAAGATIEYDATTGVALPLDVAVRILEFPGSAGFPHATQAFSVGISHDPTVVTALSIAPAGPVAALHGGAGPEFFGTEILPTGITAGVLYTFQSATPIAFEIAKDVLSIDYVFEETALDGDLDGAFTILDFSDELGSPPVVNTVVVGGLDLLPLRAQSVLTFVPEPVLPSFTRADSNADDAFNIADAIFLLSFLFSSGPAPICRSASDANDDGMVDIGDAIFVLQWLFSSGPLPPSPHPGCGTDPTPDGLSCDSYPFCP